MSGWVSTKLRGSSLTWEYRDHWWGENARFNLCGLYVYVQDLDGDFSEWTITNGKGGPVLAEGSSCGHDDFVDAAAQAEAALRRLIQDRIAQLRSSAVAGPVSKPTASAA